MALETATAIFTDGSLSSRGAGSAAVLIRKGACTASSAISLPTYVSILVAELVAISLALDLCHMMPSHHVPSKIFVDSQAALKHLRQGRSDIAQSIVRKTHALLHKGTSIDFVWIKAHTDHPLSTIPPIFGNIVADSLAGLFATPNEEAICTHPVPRSTKRSILRRCPVSRSFTSSSLKITLKQKTRKAWECTLPKMGRTINFFFGHNYISFSLLSNELELLSAPIVSLLQGHNFLPYSGYLYGKRETSNCPFCQQPDANAIHFITTCPAFDLDRHMLITETPSPTNFIAALRNRRTRVKWLAFLQKIALRFEKRSRSHS
jgi:ribonuclease HI